MDKNLHDDSTSLPSSRTPPCVVPPPIPTAVAKLYKKTSLSLNKINSCLFALSSYTWTLPLKQYVYLFQFFFNYLRTLCGGHFYTLVCGGHLYTLVCGGHLYTLVCGGHFYTLVCGGHFYTLVCDGHTIISKRITPKCPCFYVNYDENPSPNFC